MPNSSKVLIIGGGPAAIEAAITSKLFVENVTIISKNKIGDWKKLGISNGLLEYYDKKRKCGDVLGVVKKKLNKWSSNITDTASNRGIDLLFGEVISIYPDHVKYLDSNNHEKESYYDKLFIAIGSSNYFPEEMMPDGKYIFSPNNIDQLDKWPNSIIVIGNGPISYEYVNIFQNKGTKVKWLAPELGPSTPFDPCISIYLNEVYKNRGIEIINGKFVRKITKKKNEVVVFREDGTHYTAEKAFISIGLKSNIRKLDIEHLGFEYSEKGEVMTNEVGCTNHENIYIIGDARRANSASLSMKQGRLAALDALSDRKVDNNLLLNTPIIFNQNPQIAIIGHSSNQSNNSLKINFKDRNFKSLMGTTSDGFIKVTWDNDQRLTSAIIVGNCASEIITPLSLAIQLKTNLEELANFYPPHPSQSEIAFTLLREIEYQITTENG